MKRPLIPVLALCGAMLLPVMPVTAAYESADEIAFAVRSADSPDTDVPCVYVTPEEAENGKTLHFQLYLEAERAEISLLGMKLVSDCETVTFDTESLHPANLVTYEEEQTYTLPDGTAFTTKFAPYCLGELNFQNDYSPRCMSYNYNADPEDNSLTVFWMYGIGQQTAFLGGTSDYFPFGAFDAAVAPGTAPGIYHLDFVTDPNGDAKQAETDHLTYVVSDNGTRSVSEYHNLIPTLKGIRIVVDGDQTGLRGDINDNGAVNAEDATSLLIYAANKGAGNAASLTGGEEVSAEEQAFVRADVDRSGSLDAADATYILIYSAMKGAGLEPDWAEILGA